MATPPERSEIVASTFEKDDQDLAARIGAIVNLYISQNNAALTRNLTWDQNIRGMRKSIQIEGNGPLSFKYDQQFTPVGVWIVGWTDLSSSPVEVTDGVTVDWIQDGKQNITLRHVSGLDPAKKYQLEVLVLAG
jgi:hypothetical protein